MTKRLQEIHPGEILLEEFMKPMAITARRLSADIDVSASRISEIVNGQRPITADTALRLGIYFSMEPRFWLNLQAEYDMRVVTRELKKKDSSTHQGISGGGCVGQHDSSYPEAISALTNSVRLPRRL